MPHQPHPAPAAPGRALPTGTAASAPTVESVPAIETAPTVGSGAPEEPAAAPVLDLRVGGVRLMLEVPARLHVLASGLITSGLAAGLGYLFAHR
ncbi:hypothetical protein ABZW10_19310 [Kitasatospora sp. NPDC004723]|uniref:hypothetical protein n=1 Tax=Kitasatospora sp. NPDC004723 TaxID=3154288 RepID=UPI0033BE814D